MTVFSTYQGASTFMRRAFDWKRSRTSVLEVEVEAVLQSCIVSCHVIQENLCRDIHVFPISHQPSLRYTNRKSVIIW
jgi:hypothetical protein